MTWTKLAEEFGDDDAIAKAGVLGQHLYIHGLIYCNRNLTDGFIPTGRVRGLVDMSGVYVEPGNETGQPISTDGGDVPVVSNASPIKVANTLCKLGLWEHVEGGYQVRHFLDYNPSKQDVLELRATRAEAGKAGGKARWAKEHKQNPKQNGSKESSKAVANSSPVAVTVAVTETVTVKGKGRAISDPRVQQIFEVWTYSLPIGVQRRLTEQRRRVINGALQRASLEDCLDAVQGWQYDDWPKRQQVNDLDDCLRPANLERFRDWQRGINRPNTAHTDHLGREVASSDQLRDMAQMLRRRQDAIKG